MNTIRVRDKEFAPYISAAEIETAVKKLAQQLDESKSVLEDEQKARAKLANENRQLQVCWLVGMQCMR